MSQPTTWAYLLQCRVTELQREVEEEAAYNDLQRDAAQLAAARLTMMQATVLLDREQVGAGLAKAHLSDALVVHKA